jgi:predicted transcriptional regulator
MKEPIMSVTSYAKMLGLTRQAIVKRIKKNQPLPGVKHLYKTGEKTCHYILIME